MNRALSAIAGGVAGTAILSLGLIVTDVETGYQIGIFEAIAEFVGTPQRLALGFVLFVLAGVLAWPLVFLVVESALPGDRDPAMAGMALAVLLWAAFVIAGSAGVSGALLIPYLAFTFVAHLAYGYTLGAVYDQLVNADADAETARRASV